MTETNGLVLNVEDDESKRYLHTHALKAAGLDVVEADSLEQARSLVGARRPDLVLLDIRLPDGDGRDMCAWIKSTPETAQIAVLLTSAMLSDPRDRAASLDAGADGYLIQPIEPEELVAHVRALLRMRKAERDKHAALYALQEADRRKDEFLAMLAHELRNPLAPIRNAVEILRSDNAGLRERARSIVERQVAHLARLVDDLLEVSRITRKKVVLRRSSVSLRSIVDGGLELARPLAEENRHALEVRMPGREVWLDVDALRMAQVIGNLLHNAAKFTPPGGRILLEAQVEGHELEIRVSDNGVGLAPDFIARVFDLFIQDDRSLARSQGGLGIGLSLVRGIVELHGGTIEAHSSGRDQGATFTVRIPLAAGPALTQRAEPSPAPRTPSRRVLVVEDHADSAEAMRLVLQGEGHDVSVVSGGEEAIERARAWRPEIVLMDLGLPGMDGFELAEHLRAMPEMAKASIIAVSGYGQEQDRARSAAAGFDEHLTKPVEPARLAMALRRYAPRGSSAPTPRR